MLITTKVVSRLPEYGNVYSIHLYVIIFASNERQVGGFVQFPPLTVTI
jgi:hypothetical protein